jgi:hypothetical protein
MYLVMDIGELKHSGRAKNKRIEIAQTRAAGSS